MIKREMYLERIRPFYDSDLIKIITGMRRCGKSVILNQIMGELKGSGIRDEDILHINFELMDYAHIRTAEDLTDYVESFSTGTGKKYLFFDEIQNVEGFEKGINSLRASMDSSIFITGSNGKLLSGDLATILTGRFVEFRVMPFTYRECKKFMESEKRPFTFENFLEWGGMPQRLQYANDDEIRAYLESLQSSIILRDIISLNRVGNPAVLERIVVYILSNTSKTFSPNSIRRYLRSEGVNISSETIYNYVDHIVSSLIVNRARRFDTHGKNVMASREKYYVADMGIARSRWENLEIEMGSSIETVVFNELLARGYRAYVGKTGEKEVDFVAAKGGETSYFQVTAYIYDEKIAEREFGALESIPDNHPKYVISLDRIDMSRRGIKHMNLEDFLMSDRL